MTQKNESELLNARGISTLPGPSGISKSAQSANNTPDDDEESEPDEKIEDYEENEDIAGFLDGDSGAREEPAAATDVGGISGQRLKSFIERVERLEEEKAGIAADVKDIFGEAKAVGFDTKIMRKVIRLRKMDKQKRDEEAELLELYKAAIGLD